LLLYYHNFVDPRRPKKIYTNTSNTAQKREQGMKINVQALTVCRVVESGRAVPQLCLLIFEFSG